ncbi:MAG: hypothetical protein J7K40_00185 [candidate division Zixibacteria bacterium]|nr:hypothetical protein [candidate division Zixibacteria bacterium]
MKKLLITGAVCLLLIAATSIGHADVIMSEDFESGLPVTWTVVDSSWDTDSSQAAGADTYTWVIDSRSLSQMDGDFMIYDSDDCCPAIARDQLITPIIDCSGYSSVTLDFSCHYRYSWSGSGDVDIRISGGAWQNVAHYSGSDNIQEVSIDISSYADDQSSVEIRWYYYDAQCDYWWGVDNVEITGTTIIADDIAAISIDEPSVVMFVDSPYTPKVTVENVGSAAQTFDLHLVIENTVLLAIVYDQTVTSIALDPSASTQVVFTPDFTPTTEDDYTFTAAVVNTGDGDASNDTVAAVITAYQHYCEGGPDTYGNFWKDNTVVGGPTFSYIDITGTGTPVGNGDDTGYGPFPINFSFPFYGVSYTNVNFNTNGLITLTATTGTRFNYCPIPGAGDADYFIAPFWDDLNMLTSDGANIYYQYFDDDVDYLVLQWHNFIIYGESGDPMDMEVILFEDGEILFQYNYINDLDDGHGEAATVGIEQDAGDGLSYLCMDDHPGNRLYSGLAILWSPPLVDHDAGVASIDNPTAPLVAVGVSCDVTATITNNGNYGETFDAFLDIQNSSAVTIFADTVSLTIAADDDDQAVFDSWVIDVADDYTITVSVDLTGDEVPGNDELSAPIKAVSTVAMPVAQDFEGTFPPVGWTIFDFGGEDPWNVSTSQYRSPTHSALSKYDWMDDADDWFVMAPIDMSAGGSISWQFYEQDSEYNSFADNGLRHTLYACAGDYFDPATAVPFVIHTPADHTINDFGGDPVDLDISSLGGNSHVWLAYRFENARQTEYWWIDDVNIFSVPNADVGVYSIDLPFRAIVENCDSPVEATVKNYGLLAQSFDVNVTITGDVLGEVYNHTVNVANLDPDASLAVAFPVFVEPQVDIYTIDAATLLPADENTSNDAKSKATYANTVVDHRWDDDEADGSSTPFPLDNSMSAVKYTPLASDFTILSGSIYIYEMSGDPSEYAEFEWVKICPDLAGAPDIDNPYGTIEHVGTYESNVPVLLPIDITDVPVTGYSGDIWIVAKYWDSSDDFLCIGIDDDDPDGYSYYTSGATPPNWQLSETRDYIMRITVEYEPCGGGPDCYEYMAGDVNQYLGLWIPRVIGGDVTFLVNYFKGSPASVPCMMNNPSASQPYFWASADANGDCIVMGSDVIKLVGYFRGAQDISWCADYLPCWHPVDPAFDPPPATAPSGWPNCATPPVQGKVISTDSSK